MYKKIAFIFSIICSVSMYAQPRIWNMQSIDNAKSLNSEAAKYVIREADKYLITKLVTVMDKPMTPPSGDKHDYMSMGRYWWPDPKKADGLPYIRKDGVVNREIDKLDRMPLSKMERSVYLLSLAYYLTNDENYAAKAVENLRIWFINKETKMNPNMNFGQTIPGRKEGKGRGEGVLDTYSFVEMLDGVELLKTSKSFKKKDREELNNWFTTYLDWMLTSEIGNEERSAKNNHGTAYDVQVARYALFVGKEDLTRNIIDQFPAKRLFKQIEPDGSQPLELARTTAFGYSVYNIMHFLDMCAIANTLNINLLDSKSEDGRCIVKAIDFLLPFIGKQVTDFPFKQIKDWDSVQQKLRWQLYRVDKMLSKPLYENYYYSVINKSVKDIECLIY
ncbi:MAG: alginate lyase family protein [Paludibacter sp.]